MPVAAEEDKLAAMDSRWDHENYCVKTLKGKASNDFLGEMTRLDLLEIPPDFTWLFRGRDYSSACLSGFRLTVCGLWCTGATCI